MKYLGAEINPDKLNSLIENRDMLAENLSEQIAEIQRKAPRQRSHTRGKGGDEYVTSRYGIR
ncbi:hypothetical protein GCM10026986_23220 [Nitrincola alkalisediminis]